VSENGAVEAPATQFCGARKRDGSGERCRLPAGHDTPHLGTGSCALHGGNTPNHLMAGAQSQARVLGAPIDIAPHDALLYCVRRVAGEVAYYQSRISALEEEAAVGASTTTVSYAEKRDGVERVGKTKREDAVDVNIWIRLHTQALDRLARYAKMAIDAGIEERQVKLAEQWGETMASLVELLFDSLATSQSDRARVLPILEARMLQLEDRSSIVN
jgi:hypothetical protein